MKRKLVLVTGILVTVACTMSGTYAYYQDSVTVSNHISTGDVNIGIQEYEKDGDSEKFYQARQTESYFLPRLSQRFPELQTMQRLVIFVSKRLIQAKHRN